MAGITRTKTAIGRGTWSRRLVIAGCLGLILGAIAAWPDARLLHRMGIDALIAIRHNIDGPLFPPAESAVVAVVIDEETYRTPPFTDTPKVAWTPMLAEVIDAVDRAGARVIGLDLIYPTSLDRRNLLPGYDKPLLKSFFRAGRAGRLILGETRLSQQTIRPYLGQIRAAGGPSNVKSLNLVLDADEVVRRYRPTVPTETGGAVTTFAAELARRAGFALPTGDFLINYNTGPGDVPTYSLADLHACRETGRDAFFAEHFADRIVIIGSALDLEDRRVPAKRFAIDRDNGTPARCVLSFDADRFGAVADRRSIPGIYVHAAAVNTIANDNALTLLPPVGIFALVAAGASGLALLFFLLPPMTGLAAGVAALVAEGVAALFAFRYGLVLPIGAILLAAIAAYTIVYAYRFVVEDKTKRRIQHAFRHYLAPSLVDRLADDAGSLKLGGESRRVTIWFSDIVGYTSISERLRETPELLVEVINEYFTTVTEIVERHGGYIDKFIGDAVMAVWGAPLPDAEAERHAVGAALDCLAALDDFNRDVVRGKYGLPDIGTRIGINTGTAVVGNMGSTGRFNYTVTGDTVNLAARLEGANKTYGSLLMVGEETARKLGDDFVLRRLDRLVVKGRTQPVKVYEVVGRRAEVGDNRLSGVRAFHSALALYYRRRFADAIAAFQRLAGDDEAAAMYVERCEHYLAEPPPANWDRAFVATTK